MEPLFNDRDISLYASMFTVNDYQTNNHCINQPVVSFQNVFRFNSDRDEKMKLRDNETKYRSCQDAIINLPGSAILPFIFIIEAHG